MPAVSFTPAGVAAPLGCPDPQGVADAASLASKGNLQHRHTGNSMTPRDRLAHLRVLRIYRLRPLRRPTVDAPPVADGVGTLSRAVIATMSRSDSSPSPHRRLLSLSRRLPGRAASRPGLDEASLGHTPVHSHRADGHLPVGLPCGASPHPSKLARPTGRFAVRSSLRPSVCLRLFTPAPRGVEAAIGLIRLRGHIPTHGYPRRDSNPLDRCATRRTRSAPPSAMPLEGRTPPDEGARRRTLRHTQGLRASRRPTNDAEGCGAVGGAGRGADAQRTHGARPDPPPGAGDGPEPLAEGQSAPGRC